MSRASRYTLHASHPRDTRDLDSFRRSSLRHNKGCTFPSCIIPKRCACLDAAVRRISSRALLIVTRGRKRSGKGIHRVPVRKGKRATQQPARRLREGSNFDSGTPPPPPPHLPSRGPFPSTRVLALVLGCTCHRARTCVEFFEIQSAYDDRETIDFGDEYTANFYAYSYLF